MNRRNLEIELNLLVERFRNGAYGGTVIGRDGLTHLRSDILEILDEIQTSIEERKKKKDRMKAKCKKELTKKNFECARCGAVVVGEK